MKALINLGRYIYAIPVGIFGVLHYMNADAMAAMVPIAGGKLWIFITGTALILSAVSIFLGKLDKLACVLLAIMLIFFVLLIHLPGTLNSDVLMKQANMTAVLKDLALAGGALMCADHARDNSVIG